MRDTIPAVTAPHDLDSPEYALLAEMRHASLADFVIEYFIRRATWLVWLHHAMSIATIAAIVFAAIATGRSWKGCLADFGLAFPALFLIILPLHELLHAAAYRLAGARDIRWDYSLRLAAVWVIAHRFVATAGPFVFVALAPFVVLNAALVAGAILVPKLSVLLLFVLLWHLHGAIGDWSLLNFIWIHRRRGFWTYDDADSGTSYFYGRRVVWASGLPANGEGRPEAYTTRRSAGLPLSVGQASLPVRLLIALVFLVTALLCIGGGMFISGTAAAARAVAVVLIVPIGLIGLVAAAFVPAPHSRFGTWLDRFLPRLREPRVAILTAIVHWLIAFLVT